MEAEMDEHLGYEKGQRSVFPSNTALLKAFKQQQKNGHIPLEIGGKFMVNYQ